MRVRVGAAQGRGASVVGRARRSAPDANAASAPNPAASELYKSINPALRIIITLTVMAATLLEVLDTSIVNVALPEMMGNMGVTLDQIGWVSTGYIITNVIVLPLTGWLSDYFGRKRYLTYSVILFTVASFLCGTSHTLPELVLWRVMQGAGGAAFLSTAQATLMEIFPPEKRGMAQGLFGIGVVMAPTLGPTLGGYITDNYSWPWIFFVNVPIGIVAAILTMLYVPDSSTAGHKRSVDALGIGFLAVGLGCMQTVLERGERDDWFQAPYIVWLSLISVVTLGLFIWWELRPQNQNPAVNLRVVRNSNLAVGCMFGFVLGFVLYGGNFALPQFWQSVQRHTAQQAGMLLFPGGLTTGLMMPLIGVLVSRVDTRILVGAGMALFTFAMFQFSIRMTLGTPDEAFWWPLVLRGAAMSMIFVPLSIVALGTLNGREIADGAGLYNLFRQLGGSFGIALLTTLLDRRSHLHYERMAEHVNVANPLANAQLTQLQNGFIQKGMAPQDALHAAYAALAGTVQAQAAVMSFADVFHFMFWVGAGATLMVVLLRKARNRGAAAAAH